MCHTVWAIINIFGQFDKMSVFCSCLGSSGSPKARHCHAWGPGRADGANGKLEWEIGSLLKISLSRLPIKTTSTLSRFKKPDFGILQNALTFCVSNINTNKWYKRSFAQISLLLLVLDMAFLYSKIQGGIMQNSIVNNNFWLECRTNL